jgi:glycerol-3-phosphate dehydrogenase
VLKRDPGALVAREHDVLVIGGGIYGAAAAWDAAQRGLSVGLVEARDFGSGVSWNSLKTVHGGLRHLQRLRPGLTRESMRERRALLLIAPAVVRPLRFLLPTYGHGLRGREILRLGLLVNDVLTPDRNRGLPRDQRVDGGRALSRRDVLALCPGLPDAGLTGGVEWSDAQVTSTERLLIGLLHASASQGAVLANYAEVVGLVRSGARVAGARVRDHVSGADLEVRARIVLNAAGPGMDAVQRLAGLAPPPAPLLGAMNLVLRRSPLPGVAVGARSDGRHLFLVPWRDRALLGTAYAAAGTPLRAGDFLAEASRAFPWAGLVPEDVALVHRGLVPGRSADPLPDRPVIVDHEDEGGVPGLVSLLGVKYTTARGVAARAVDVVARRLGRATAPCRTAQTLLPEARPLEGSLSQRTLVAVREEAALHLTDSVLRRLDIGTGGAAPAADVDTVARTMAAALGWSDRQTAGERRLLSDTYTID